MPRRERDRTTGGTAIQQQHGLDESRVARLRVSRGNRAFALPLARSNAEHTELRGQWWCCCCCASGCEGESSQMDGDALNALNALNARRVEGSGGRDAGGSGVGSRAPVAASARASATMEARADSAAETAGARR